MEVNKLKYCLTDNLNDLKNCASVTSVIENKDKLFFENLKWLTSSETIIYLRLPTLNALRQLVYRRKIPFYKLGRRLLFNKAELDLLIESSPKQRKAA